MNIPFTVGQFLDLFSTYNNAIWPLQIVLNLAALGIIIHAIRRYSFSDRIISVTLGVFWFWMGIVYHLMFFTQINPAAWGFGILFIIQGILFILQALKNNITYRATFGWSQTLGSILIAYALFIYPIIGLNLGHVYPAAPSFGAPCPTTIFTFGVLLWAVNVPRYLLFIPGLWSIIGFSAALSMGIREDIGLFVAAIITVSILGVAKPRPTKTPAA